MKKTILTVLFCAALLCGGFFSACFAQPSVTNIPAIAESIVTSPVRQDKKAIHFNEFRNRDQSSSQQNTSRLEAAPCPPCLAACRYRNVAENKTEKQSIPRSRQAANPGKIRAGPRS